MCPAIVSGIFTGDAPVSYWASFFLSLVTFPDIFSRYSSGPEEGEFCQPKYWPIRNSALFRSASPALSFVLFHTVQVTSGYIISLIRDPKRGTSQLYLRVAWTSAFKQFIPRSLCDRLLGLGFFQWRMTSAPAVSKYKRCCRRVEFNTPSKFLNLKGNHQ